MKSCCASVDKAVAAPYVTAISYMLRFQDENNKWVEADLSDFSMQAGDPSGKSAHLNKFRESLLTCELIPAAGPLREDDNTAEWLFEEIQQEGVPDFEKAPNKNLILLGHSIFTSLDILRPLKTVGDIAPKASEDARLLDLSKEEDQALLKKHIWHENVLAKVNDTVSNIARAVTCIVRKTHLRIKGLDERDGPDNKRAEELVPKGENYNHPQIVELVKKLVTPPRNICAANAEQPSASELSGFPATTNGPTAGPAAASSAKQALSPEGTGPSEGLVSEDAGKDGSSKNGKGNDGPKPSVDATWWIACAELMNEVDGPVQLPQFDLPDDIEALFKKVHEGLSVSTVDAAGVPVHVPYWEKFSGPMDTAAVDQAYGKTVRGAVLLRHARSMQGKI